MWNNSRGTPPYPTNIDEVRIAGLTAYTSIINSSLGKGVRSQAESIVQQKDGAGRVTKKTFNFANGAKIEDLLFYPSDPAGLVTFEIRGAYSDLNGMPLVTGGRYDAGTDGRYGSARSIATERKANQAPLKVTVSNVDGTRFVDIYTYANESDLEASRVDQGTPVIPTIGYDLTLSGSVGELGSPVTLTYNFPAVHPACQLVPTVYGGVGSFSSLLINVAANAPQATVTFTPQSSGGVFAIGTANSAGLRDPGYKSYTIGVPASNNPPGDGTSPVAGIKLREKAIRTSAILDVSRRPISVTYYYADNSTILDRYRYELFSDSDPTEILFNTTPTAVFPGNVGIVPSGTPPTYNLKLRELAVRVFNVLDAQGRAISSTYYYADGSETLDRYRYAAITDIDPTESLFDTTALASFLGNPVTPPIASANLGSRSREQSAGTYSMLNAQGRAVSTVYYYGDFVRVLDRSRFAASTDLAPAEILFNTTASANFLGAPTGTFARNSLGASTREQSICAYSTIDAQGRTTDIVYKYPDRLVVDRYRYAAIDDSVPIETLLDTIPSAAFLNVGSAPIATEYSIGLSAEPFVRGEPITVRVFAESPFVTGCSIAPVVSGVSGALSAAILAVGQKKEGSTIFTPTTSGTGVVTVTNDRGLPNPANKSFSVAHQRVAWGNFVSGATAVGDRLTLPSVARAGGTFALTAGWKEVQFLVDNEAGFNKGNCAIGLLETSSNPGQLLDVNLFFKIDFSASSTDRTNYRISCGGEQPSLVNSYENDSRIVSFLRSGNNDIIIRSSSDGVNWREELRGVNVVDNRQLYLGATRSNDYDKNGIYTDRVISFPCIVL